jgi:DNA-binding NtrC family response regulator
LSELLSSEGYQVDQAADGSAAIALVDKADYDIVLTDLKLPGPDGIAVLKHVRDVAPQTLVMIMTAYGSLDSAIEAMRLGAQDYILKPLIFDEVLHKVRRLMEHRSLAWEIQMLRKEVSRQFASTQPTGQSPGMREIITLIQKVGPAPSTVLITGESGVGKEVVARAIHEYSPRRGNVFLPVNCSAIPETLLESQLFGHVKGAFTGATNSQEGLFQHAGGGTIFLDELGEMPLSLQPKLLRAIEEKQVLPVGSTHPIHVDVRIIASTNRDLKDEVESGRFRDDLFYRFNVIGIHIPPLRERREDIPLLVDHLIQRHNREMKKNYKGVDNAAMRVLLSLPWKGNIRELDNVLERAMILGNGEWVTAGDLPGKAQSASSAVAEEDNLSKALEVYEKIHIDKTLAKADGDKRRAAELLGLSLSTLYRKMEHLGIDL